MTRQAATALVISAGQARLAMCPWDMVTFLGKHEQPYQEKAQLWLQNGAELLLG